MKLQPIGNSIIVQLDEPENKTRGGILLPDIAKKTQLRGTVVAIGPGKRRDDGQIYPVHDGQLKIGMKILFARFSGDGETFSLDGKVDDHKAISENEVRAIIVEE